MDVAGGRNPDEIVLTSQSHTLMRGHMYSNNGASQVMQHWFVG